MKDSWYFSRDLEGVEYVQFFQEFYQDWSEFQFFLRSDLPPLSKEGEVFIKKLQPFVIKTEAVTSYHASNKPLKNGVTAKAISVATSYEAIKIVLGSSMSFFKWVRPFLPEDIQIFDKNGNIWLRSITHEGFFEVRPDKRQLEIFRDKFPSLLVSHEDYLKRPPKSYYEKIYDSADE